MLGHFVQGVPGPEVVVVQTTTPPPCQVVRFFGPGGCCFFAGLWYNKEPPKIVLVFI